MEAGFGLVFKADALWMGTAIDGVEGSAGNLAATAAAVPRTPNPPRFPEREIV